MKIYLGEQKKLAIDGVDPDNAEHVANFLINNPDYFNFYNEETDAEYMGTYDQMDMLRISMDVVDEIEESEEYEWDQVDSDFFSGTFETYVQVHTVIRNDI